MTEKEAIKIVISKIWDLHQMNSYFRSGDKDTNLAYTEFLDKVIDLLENLETSDEIFEKIKQKYPEIELNKEANLKLELNL